MRKYLIIALSIGAIGLTQDLSAQEGEKNESAELAKKLANPVASLISVPLQNNLDVGIGDDLGSKNTLNIQPVIPLRLTDNINVITRVILPVISQQGITGSENSEFGLGDAVMSAFISPAESKGGLTWGAGPVLLVPTATHDLLASKKFGLGPTAVALYQSKGFTLGGLINQVWSIAGDANRPNVNMMFFQPFLNYNWKTGAGIGANFEITRNWDARTTNIWLNPTVSALTAMGNQKIQFAIGPRLNLAAPDGVKAKYGVRAVIVFLFPK
jgi:hypothetical protein